MIYFQWRERKNCTMLFASLIECEEGWPVCIVAPYKWDLGGNPTGWSYDIWGSVSKESPFSLDQAPVSFGIHEYAYKANAISVAETFLREHLHLKLVTIPDVKLITD